MIEWALAGALAMTPPQQDPTELDRLQTCVAHMLAVETAIEEGHWTSIPGARLPAAGSTFRMSGMILLLDALAKAAEREGIDVRSLAPGIEAKALQAPRAQTAEDVALALKLEADCFRTLAVEQED